LSGGFSRPFILRPVATTLLMAAILLAGAIAYRLLPVSALPQIDTPTIEVRTFYPGASPEVMAAAVTAPLERQFGQMPGLTQMSSTSAYGASVATLQFNLALPLDSAEQQVQAAINAAASFLPADLPAPPTYAKINPADAPVLTLAATSKSLPLTRVQDLVDNRVAQKLSQLSGVGLVSVGGGARAAVAVRADPARLAALNLSLEDLRAAIGAANVNLPKGNIDGAAQQFALGANDQLKTPQDYESLVVALRKGAPVRLRDVATVEESAENRELGAWSQGEAAIVVDVRRQPGANVIGVVDQIKALLPSLQASLPASVELAVISDRTATIRASVADVQFELVLAVLLVVAVIYVFLRDARATLIPSVAVPVSLIGGFIAMYLLGFSLNNLTLMALTVASGFVVDDAIVMVENIARYLEAGHSPREAALRGAQEIGFTIVSLTVSLIAVLIPLLFMGDVTGRLFREFAVTLAVTIVISALVSLTVAPMLAAKILRAQDVHTHHMGEKSGWFDRLIEAYGVGLRAAIRHSRLTLALFAATLVGSVALYIAIPKGFFPLQDVGLIEAIVEGGQSLSYDSMATLQRELTRDLLDDPAVAGVSSLLGVDGVNRSLNAGRLLIVLKPQDERRERGDTLGATVARLKQTASRLPGVALYLRPVQDLTMDSGLARGAYYFVLQDANAAELQLYAPRLVEALSASPALRDVASSAANSGRALHVEIDRDAAARYGVSVAAIDNVLYDAFAQRIVSTIFTQASQYRVLLESAARTGGREALGSLRVANASGGQTPLSSVTRVREIVAPLTIDHLAQFPATTISFNLAPGASLSDAQRAIEAAKAEVGTPASVLFAWQGALAAFNASSTGTVLLVLAAIVTVYIVLGVLYESTIHPLTILSTLPSAGIGALLALMLAGQDLGVIGVIGVILLIGIVKKNAIMMIDFAIAARRAGASAEEAIVRACLLRFRPILMTTLAALFGAAPLIFGGGEGAELRFPLGVSIAGGLIFSQILTLFSTPVIYLAFDSLSVRLSAPRAAAGAPAE
jgi:multidrug efflux pump